jgi:signal transduction histidine kinase
MRHASAKRLVLRLGHEGDEVVLELEDDGVGIDPLAAGRPDSFGIIGMRERCAAFGGSLSLVGLPGQGTTVTARLKTSGGRPAPRTKRRVPWRPRGKEAGPC